MKRLLSIFLLLLAGSAGAIVTEHTNTANLVLANVCDGTFSDFKFTLSGYDEQRFNFNYDQTLGNVACQFRITKPIEGTIYLDIPATDVTVSGSNVSFNIARTNIPPAGSYYGELLSYDTATTNIYRSIAQGKLPITFSLYNNETNYFNRSTTNAGVGQVYVHPNWIDPPWLTTSAAPSTLYYTMTKGDTLSGYVDTVNGVVAGIQANTSTYQTVASSMNSYSNQNWTTNWLYYSGRTLFGTITNAYDLHWRSVSNSVVANADNGQTAYTWGDHASAGYLSVTQSIYSSLTIGNRSKLTTNLCDLTSSYAGSLTQIAYTGYCAVVRGKTYEYSFTKNNALAGTTGTLTIGTFSLSATGIGAVSNYFSPLVSSTNIILTLSGNGSSLSGASNVYVKEITNGYLYVTDLSVGHSIYLGSSNSIYFPTFSISEQDIINWNMGSNSLNKAIGAVQTNLNTASNVLNNAIGAVQTNLNTASNMIGSLVASTGGWNTAQSQADGLNSRSNAWETGAAQAGGMNSRSSAWDTATAQAAGLNSRSSAWDTAASQASGLNSRSSVWEQTATDYLTTSNDVAIIKTNYVQKLGDTMTGALLTTRTISDGFAGGELVPADFVRSLLSGGAYLYNITNANPFNTNYYTASLHTNLNGLVRTYVITGANQYVGGIMSTSRYTTVYSPMAVSAYLGRNSGGGYAVSIYPEFYYSYDGTNLLGDYNAAAQVISTGSNLYQWVISFPTIIATNTEGVFVIRKFKVSSYGGSPTLSIYGNGGATPSHFSFSTPPLNDPSLGVRGATNAVFTGNWTTSTYDTVGRTLTIGNPGYAEKIAELNTNSLRLTGGIMSGPATNTAGWYGEHIGNGANLTNLPSGSSASYWSGYSATQIVAWVSHSTNTDVIYVVGTLTPDASGIYTSIAAINGYAAWSNGTWWICTDGTLYPEADHYLITSNQVGSAPAGGDSYWLGPHLENGPLGNYTPGNASGTASTRFDYTAGSGIGWQAGVDYTNTPFAWRLKYNGVDTLLSYAASNVLLGKIWGNGSGLTNLPSTAVNGLDGATNALNNATGSLNTAVGNLNASTTTLNTAIGNLNSATGTLNTATNTLQTQVTALQGATGTLNSAVSALNSATGTLNTATNALQTQVTALAGSTNALNTAINALNNATGSLNTAVGNLNASTTTLNTAVGNLNLSTNAMQVRLGNVETNAYQAFTASVIPDAGGTCTITTAHGSLVKIHQANFSPATNAITITIPTNGFSENGVNRIGVELYFTGSTAFATATITNPTALTISTTATNSLFFRRSMNALKWTGRQ